MTSHESNACSVFASQTCLCATHIMWESMHVWSAEHRDVDIEKALLSYDVTTKVLVTKRFSSNLSLSSTVVVTSRVVMHVCVASVSSCYLCTREAMCTRSDKHKGHCFHMMSLPIPFLPFFRKCQGSKRRWYGLLGTSLLMLCPRNSGCSNTGFLRVMENLESHGISIFSFSRPWKSRKMVKSQI